MIPTAMEAWKGGPYRLPRQSRQKPVALESTELSLSVYVCVCVHQLSEAERVGEF